MKQLLVDTLRAISFAIMDVSTWVWRRAEAIKEYEFPPVPPKPDPEEPWQKGETSRIIAEADDEGFVLVSDGDPGDPIEDLVAHPVSEAVPEQPNGLPGSLRHRRAQLRGL